ncbi:MAG: Asp-tRNA(Asn)/Glu-tRNA(Gln) amidotransferase subunit GatC [Spiroplasma sp.]
MMKKKPELTLKFLHQLAEDLFFQLNDQEYKNLLLEFNAIEKQMAVVKKINTKDVLPLDFPFDVKRDYLRSDTIESSLTIKEVLSLAAQVKDDYVVINRVVGNEKN